MNTPKLIQKTVVSKAWWLSKVETLEDNTLQMNVLYKRNGGGQLAHFQ
jgi:hypothetical protein